MAYQKVQLTEPDGCRVLVVGTDQTTKLTIERSIEGLPVTLYWARGYEDALASIHQQAVDLVIVDTENLSPADTKLCLKAPIILGRSRPSLAILGSSQGIPDGPVPALNKPLGKGPFLDLVYRHSNLQTSGSQSTQDSFDFSDLLPKFLHNRRKDFDLLAQALVESDFETIANRCHSIKGVSPLYGFDELGSLAAQMEKDAKEKNLDNCVRLLAQMRSCL